LNIENTYGHPVTQSQAIALSTQGDKFAGYGVKLSGWQDTLLANYGGNFFSNSWIEGEVDFVRARLPCPVVSKRSLMCVYGIRSSASGRRSGSRRACCIPSLMGTSPRPAARPTVCPTHPPQRSSLSHAYVL
jgi:hypothetical protein